MFRDLTGAAHRRSWSVAVRRGARRFVGSRFTWLLWVLGAAWGLFLFCYPEVQLKVEQPGGWEAIWGASRVSTWLRCLAITGITTVAPSSALLIAFIVSEARREPYV